MNCPRCKEMLLDAALGALPPAAHAELHAHLDACSACRAEFEAQLLLVTAMDSGIATAVAGEPSTAFAARVHERIAAAELSRQRAPRLGWRFLTAGWALAAVAIFALWMNVSGPMGTNKGSGGPLWIGFSLPQVGSLPPVPAVQEVADTPAAVASSSPSILVPPGQWSGIVRLYKAIQSERVDAASLLAAPPAARDAAIQPLELPELKIAPLEVAKPETESKPAELPPVPKRTSETSR